MFSLLLKNWLILSYRRNVENRLITVHKNMLLSVVIWRASAGSHCCYMRRWKKFKAIKFRITKNVIYSLTLMLFFSSFSSDDSTKTGLDNLTLEYKRTESFVSAAGPLLVIWIIYLVYMIITKKDKEKTIELFFLGLFFLAFWTMFYLLIF